MRTIQATGCTEHDDCQIVSVNDGPLKHVAKDEFRQILLQNPPPSDRLSGNLDAADGIAKRLEAH